MTDRRPTSAEHTATRLQDAALGGLRLMIPGAFELRPARASMSSTDRAPRAAFPVSSRVVPRRGTLERIWRYIMRPTDTPTF